MNFESFETLAKGCRTVHLFDKDQKIPHDILKKCLEVSLQAPNHKYTFPWRIILTSVETRSRLGDLAGRLAREKAGDDQKVLMAKDKALSPAELVVFCLPKRSGDNFTEREDYATLSCSIQLFALALRTHGFSYKWSTGGLSRHQESYKILGVDSENEEIIGFIWVGKPLREPMETKRPALHEVMRIV